MERDIPAQEDPPYSESMAEEGILTKHGKKGSHQYKFDPWATIGNLNAGITMDQLVEISPAV